MSVNSLMHRICILKLQINYSHFHKYYIANKSHINEFIRDSFLGTAVGFKQNLYNVGLLGHIKDGTPRMCENSRYQTQMLLAYIDHAFHIKTNPNSKHIFVPNQFLFLLKGVSQNQSVIVPINQNVLSYIQ